MSGKNKGNAKMLKQCQETQAKPRGSSSAKRLKQGQEAQAGPRDSSMAKRPKQRQERPSRAKRLKHCQEREQIDLTEELLELVNDDMGKLGSFSWILRTFETSIQRERLLLAEHAFGEVNCVTSPFSHPRAYNHWRFS